MDVPLVDARGPSESVPPRHAAHRFMTSFRTSWEVGVLAPTLLVFVPALLSFLLHSFRSTAVVMTGCAIDQLGGGHAAVTLSECVVFNGESAELTVRGYLVGGESGFSKAAFVIVQVSNMVALLSMMAAFDHVLKHARVLAAHNVCLVLPPRWIRWQVAKAATLVCALAAAQTLALQFAVRNRLRNEPVICLGDTTCVYARNSSYDKTENILPGMVAFVLQFSGVVTYILAPDPASPTPTNPVKHARFIADSWRIGGRRRRGLDGAAAGSCARYMLSRRQPLGDVSLAELHEYTDRRARLLLAVGLARRVTLGQLNEAARKWNKRTGKSLYFTATYADVESFVDALRLEARAPDP